MTNKDLISQYVDTGIKLPEYQVNKLSSSDNKTYIRKRIIRMEIINNHDWMDYDELETYEVRLMDDSDKKKYLKKYIDGLSSSYDDEIEYEIFEMIVNFPDLLKEVFKKNISLDSDLIRLIPLETRKIYLKKMLNIELKDGEGISDRYLGASLGIPELLDKILKSGVFIDEFFFSKLSNADKFKYLIYRTKKHAELDKYEIELIPKLPFDDSTINDSMVFYILQLGDEGVKIMIDRLTPKKLKQIFSKIEYWVDGEDLEPMGRELAFKYGSIKGPTVKEIFKEVVDGGYEGLDKNGKYKIMYIDVQKDGKYMYVDGDLDEVVKDLTKKEALDLVMKRIPLVFNVKK